MLYFIKFLYSWLLPPGGFIVIMLVMAVLLLRRSRVWCACCAGMALLLYLCSIPLTGDPLIRSLESRYIPPHVVEGDIIVVLGGGATSDTPDVTGSGHPSAGTAARLITAYELYRITGAPILVAGGQVFADSGNEAEIGKRTLIAMGMPQEQIFIDRESRNTEENARNVKSILESRGYKRPILVTQAFHMPRSVKNFEKLDVKVEPYPTGYYVQSHGRLSFMQFTPSHEAMYKTGLALKEFLGLLALH